MNDSLSVALDQPRYESPARFRDRWFRRLVWRRLAGLREGRVTLVDAAGRHSFGQAGARCALQATVHVYDPRAYARLVLRGSIGVGEGYMAGEWSCDDLTTLVRIFQLNSAVSNGLEDGLASFAMPLFRMVHAARRNTRGGSRRNIAAHYDLGNEFYRLFLDETLMYSCAIFPTPDADLHTASLAKLDHICRKLQLSEQDHLLEIGSGWGGLALHAAARYGCRVTTTTISRQQYELTRQRVQEAGLEGRITVLCQDYRELQGCFDKLVSIEMIEAVGHRHFDTYFRVCSRLLKPEGMMLLQAITIPDQEYERVKRAVDFIQYYIFPGGCLPSLAAISAAVAKVSDLRLFHLEDIGPHYATTLRHWRERFQANLERVRAQRFSEAFIRMWHYYLCYCEGGFMERTIGTVQMLFTKPLCRREPLWVELR
jgi:cyclopropane-fatty-acyl-phospholipid synthase